MVTKNQKNKDKSQRIAKKLKKDIKVEGGTNGARKIRKSERRSITKQK